MTAVVFYWTPFVSVNDAIVLLPALHQEATNSLHNNPTTTTDQTAGPAVPWSTAFKWVLWHYENNFTGEHSASNVHCEISEFSLIKAHKCDYN